MGKVAKMLYIVVQDNGETYVISTDKRQMARWYALDYLRDKPKPTEKGYKAVVSDGFYFSPAFRKKK
ncbi:hypothetical protein FMM80_10665 [Schaedlerella arabinosiphila]|jgi:hypothetical protein|uniref:Uncharacterized protein n=2 Tax=Schaedlerella arabinosiphila TaxID=2044587 RepID=A0A9X5C7B2_9FIRM|nr:hypothetical protein C824_002179 [Schaedlerella arabinosiphila]KAI4440151.1 hypothetical protein C824_002640 [Schaedlerella arabinosiphila]NBJ03381.1 hypothetical protein [Lachnospiraceae bacterium]NDO69122.1 hypothetical protein [Schaedlerella arabinosiphila]